MPLYPVERIRLLRTRRAPTRRFIQLLRCDASDARVWSEPAFAKSEHRGETHHEIRVPPRSKPFFVTQIQLVQVCPQPLGTSKVIEHLDLRYALYAGEVGLRLVSELLSRCSCS